MIRFILIVVAYFVGGKLGLNLALVKESVTPIWPPTGIALASLLLLGYRYAPAIFAGAFLVNITTSVPVLSIVGIASGNTLEAIVATLLLNRFGFRKDLAGVQDVLKLLLFGAGLSTLVSASIGSMSLFLGGVIPAEQLRYALQVWWLGDMTGAIWITPIVLVMANPVRSSTIVRSEFTLILLLLIFSTYLVFIQRFNYTYALFPLVLWASMRFTTFGAASAATAVSTIAIVMTLSGNGPYIGHSDNETLTILNLFIGSCSLTAFIVAAVINDRTGAQTSLEIVNRDLEIRVAERTDVLEKARMEAETAEKRALFMAESSAVLSSSLDFAATLNALAKTAVPFLADCCIIDVREPDGRINRVGVVHKDPEREKFMLQLQKQYIPDEHSPQPAARVMHTRKPELIKEVTEEALSDHVINREHFELMQKIGIRSHLAVPMVSEDEVTGVISLGLIDEGRSYDEADVLLAQEFAKHAMLAVRNSRLYQELQEANRFKDEFLATVSHELRTPLTVILGWAKTLEQLHESLSPEMKRKALQTIARSAELQAQIVEDLLDISRIRTGKFGLQLKIFSLTAILNNAVDAILPAASAKGIEIQMEADSTIDKFYGDPDRLQQTFWNLLSNAVKFTEQDGMIRVSSFISDNQVEVRIADNGEGISPDFLPYLFQRFRQADSSFKRKFGGLGLGLSLVKHFVELHGGTVFAESAGKGLGSTFIIRLPQHRPVETSQDLIPVVTATAAAPQSLKILVVDDDMDTLDLLVHIIEQEGCEVKSANNAKEGLSVIRNWRPDLLISDIAMPVEDGYELIKQVRALEDEQLNKIPAIALTAHTSDQDQRRTISAGYHLHVKKPVEPAKLIQMIRSLTISGVGAG